MGVDMPDAVLLLGNGLEGGRRMAPAAESRQRGDAPPPP